MIKYRHFGTKYPRNASVWLISGIYFVRLIGLEPTRPEPPDPKSGASTNSATSAYPWFFENAGAKVLNFIYSTKSLRANSINVSFPSAKSTPFRLT